MAFRAKEKTFTVMKEHKEIELRQMMEVEKLNNPTVKDLIEALEKMPLDNMVLLPIGSEEDFSDLIELTSIEGYDYTLLEGVCCFD